MSTPSDSQLINDPPGSITMPMMAVAAAIHDVRRRVGSVIRRSLDPGSIVGPAETRSIRLENGEIYRGLGFDCLIYE